MRTRLALGILVAAALIGSIAQGQEASTAQRGILSKALAEGKATLAPVGRVKRAPTTYGLSTETYYRISSSEFLPHTSATTYADTDPILDAFHRYPTGAGHDFVATPHLPSGALLTYLEIAFCDTNVGADLLALLFGCDYKGDNCVYLSGILSSETSAGCGLVYVDLTPAGWTVDNFANELILMIEPLASDGTISFAGAVIGYVLQVSPAPAVATFNDVPTNHPFFQFIEALSASGITVGCQEIPPLYCPDAS